MKIDRDEVLTRYSTLKELVTSDRKDSFLNMMTYIEKNTEYLTAPASAKYHLCQETGLLYHSVSVAETMIRMSKAMAPKEVSIEQCVILGLLHDVGKHNQYKKKEPTERQKQYGYSAWPPYEYREDIVKMPHEDRSLYIISNVCGFKLSEEEWEAIQKHNEPWDEHVTTRFNKNKLLTVLQNSDYWSTLYLEED